MTILSHRWPARVTAIMALGQ